MSRQFDVQSWDYAVCIILHLDWLCVRHLGFIGVGNVSALGSGRPKTVAILGLPGRSLLGEHGGFPGFAAACLGALGHTRHETIGSWQSHSCDGRRVLWTAIQSRRDRVVGVVHDDSRGEYVFCGVALHVFDGSRMQWLGFRRGVVVEYSGNAIRKTMKGPSAPFFLFVSPVSGRWYGLDRDLWTPAEWGTPSILRYAPRSGARLRAVRPMT